MSEILMRSDDRCTEGLRSLHKAFMRAITPDKPSTADTTTLIDELFGQVSRVVMEGASGPEAFTLLLRQLTAPFDRVDAGEGYPKLHNYEVSPFCDFTREFRVVVSAVRERARSDSWGRRGIGGGSDGGKRAVSHFDAYIVPWFYGHGPEAVRFVGCNVEGSQ